MRAHFARLVISRKDYPMPKSLLLAVVLTLAVMPFAFGGTLAAPGTPVAPSGTPTSTQSKHCVTLMEQDTSPKSAAVQQHIAALAARSGKSVSVERAGTHLCFATMAQVQQYFKAHGIKDGSEAGQVSAQTIGSGGYTIIVLYDNSGYGGASETFVSGTDCGIDAHYYNYVGDYINDRTSSSRVGYAPYCGITEYYRNADYSDGPYSCGDPDTGGDCWYVGDWINDATSSIGVS